MGVCGSITTDILIDCANPIIGGVKDLLYLFNYDDLNTYTKDGVGAITSLSLLGGKSGFVIEGQRQSIDVKSNLASSSFLTAFNHEITFRVFSNNAEVKKQLSGISKGNFFAVVENNFKGINGNASFEVFGIGAGLVATVIESNKSDADTQGAYVITLSGREKIKEPNLPATYFNTTYSQSLADINSLLITIPTPPLTLEDGGILLNEDGTPILSE